MKTKNVKLTEDQILVIQVALGMYSLNLSDRGLNNSAEVNRKLAEELEKYLK